MISNKWDLSILFQDWSEWPQSGCIKLKKRKKRNIHYLPHHEIWNVGTLISPRPEEWKEPWLSFFIYFLSRFLFCKRFLHNKGQKNSGKCIWQFYIDCRTLSSSLWTHSAVSCRVFSAILSYLSPILSPKRLQSDFVIYLLGTFFKKSDSKRWQFFSLFFFKAHLNNNKLVPWY